MIIINELLQEAVVEHLDTYINMLVVILDEAEDPEQKAKMVVAIEDAKFDRDTLKAASRGHTAADQGLMQ